MSPRRVRQLDNTVLYFLVFAPLVFLVIVAVTR